MFVLLTLPPHACTARTVDFFYLQDCRVAANCRYCFYSQAQNQVFRPAWATSLDRFRKFLGAFIHLTILHSSFFYSILRWSVAVSTMRRQSSRIAAFLQADARPMFCWPRSAPLHEARCGWVFLTVASNLEAAPGSPQRQHGGGPLLVSCGQYVQRAANVCQ